MDAVLNLYRDWALGRELRHTHEQGECAPPCLLCLREANDALDCLVAKRKDAASKVE